jgi:peptidyl-prolyl cis-trans isomerase-like 4
MSAVIETNVGSLHVKLHVQAAPKACINFLKLSKAKYYNWCLFHRIERDFIAQTGDPTGTGKGGESIFGLLTGSEEDKKRKRFFEDEIVEGLGHAKRGTLAMANSGKNKNASQFFVTLADGLDYLDGKYTVFGQVAEDEEGLKVLDRINEVLSDEQGNPLQKVYIKRIDVEEDPFPDPKALRIPEEDPEPTEGFNRCLAVDAAEEHLLREEKEMPAEELEMKRKREDAAAQALTLEILGDLPSADIKPPENVLFVCKLNPLTLDADLEQIFGRFGPIRSCQIIRDHDSGDSLGYAFVEFEERAACEAAYLKMDNVLIDDRRVRVDFSQSVSKLHGEWARKRRAQLGSKRVPDVQLKEEYRAEHRQGAYEMTFEGPRGRGHREDQRRDRRDDEERYRRDRRHDHRDRRDDERPRNHGHHARGDHYYQDRRRDRSRSPRRY